MARGAAQQTDNRRVELSLFGEPVVQLAQFATRRELSKPEQIAGLFKVRMIRQFVDVDATISQNSAIPVDEADFRTGGDDALESLGRMSCGHAGHWLSLRSQNLRCGTA